MKVQSLLGRLQLSIAAVGGFLILLAVGGVATMNAPPAGSEGFVHGLAVVFLYFLGWVGFTVLSLGLAVPPRGKYGIAFNRYQRSLFVTAAVAAISSAVGPFAAFGLLYSKPTLMVNSWIAIMSVAIVALAVSLIWRGVEAVNTLRHRGSP